MLSPLRPDYHSSLLVTQPFQPSTDILQANMHDTAALPSVDALLTPPIALALFMLTDFSKMVLFVPVRAGLV